MKNNRWKRNAKNKQTKKTQQKTKETESIVKGWALNNFAVRLT